MAGPGTRAALREAIAGSGDLDLVHVVAAAGRPGRFAELTGDERQYLITQLAARGEWGLLWQFVLDLPLAEAVTAVRRFGVGWRPDTTGSTADTASSDATGSGNPRFFGPDPVSRGWLRFPAASLSSTVASCGPAPRRGA